MPVLILDGVEIAPLHLASGLTKGCPASCMLYKIGVDLLLASGLAVLGSDIRVSLRERVLGVYIVIHASMNDQYYNAVNKFDMALSVFGRARTSLSLAMRLLVVNMFMYTLFSYPNLHVFMHRVLLQGKLCVFERQSHGPNWECSRQLAHCMARNSLFKI